MVRVSVCGSSQRGIRRSNRPVRPSSGGHAGVARHPTGCRNSGSPSSGNLPTELTGSAGSGCGCPRVNGGVARRPNPGCAGSGASSGRRSDSIATLSRTEVDAEVQSPAFAADENRRSCVTAPFRESTSAPVSRRGRCRGSRAADHEIDPLLFSRDRCLVDFASFPLGAADESRLDGSSRRSRCCSHPLANRSWHLDENATERRYRRENGADRLCASGRSSG